MKWALLGLFGMLKTNPHNFFTKLFKFFFLKNFFFENFFSKNEKIINYPSLSSSVGKISSAETVSKGIGSSKSSPLSLTKNIKLSGSLLTIVALTIFTDRSKSWHPFGGSWIQGRLLQFSRYRSFLVKFRRMT